MTDSAALRELTEGLGELARRRREDKLTYYRPYPKQAVFHAAGKDHRERLFLAGNQLGKTTAGGMEFAYHVTGEYPDWWKGRRFNRPVGTWAGSNTGEVTRDNVQRILLGANEDWGTGAIPMHALIDRKMSRGLANAVDTQTVRHVSGGVSSIGFKSYERGREKWQSATLDLGWLDEEPPADIYSECLARITATKGLLFITATPLKGMSEVIRRFLEDHSPDRADIRMEISEAEHIAPEERERIIEGYRPHEREARAKGIPLLGSGRVFPIAEEVIAEDGFEIPNHFARIVGLDIGWAHPTAAVWLAHDRDTDTIHVYDNYRQREETPTIHAAAIKDRKSWIPVAWPHDGLQHDKGSGDQICEQYRRQGVNMLSKHAQFQDGSYGVEAGIMDMLDRMRTGRLKVARHLEPWWQEFRTYHRKDGIIVKEVDDLMAATRYGIMMLRHARSRGQYDRSRRPLEYPPLGIV